jgi:hypothetical protein
MQPANPSLHPVIAKSASRNKSGWLFIQWPDSIARSRAQGFAKVSDRAVPQIRYAQQHVIGGLAPRRRSSSPRPSMHAEWAWEFNLAYWGPTVSGVGSSISRFQLATGYLRTIINSATARRHLAFALSPSSTRRRIASGFAGMSGCPLAADLDQIFPRCR